MENPSVTYIKSLILLAESMGYSQTQAAQMVANSYAELITEAHKALAVAPRKVRPRKS